METRARYALIGLFALGVIIAGFGFVYWLQGAGGIRQRATYQIRFESPVSGLLVGSNVLFNGIRVGEVTSLDLDPKQPKQVMATIAVDPFTPVKRDTTVGIDFQGLTGAPVVALSGGSAEASVLTASDGKTPLLLAAPNVGETLTQSARDTLSNLDKILSDNSAPLHDAISNISTFSQALARNSDKVDGILAGLERMTGGTAGKPPVPVYSLTGVRDLPPCTQTIDKQLVVPDPSALMSLSNNKIPVKGALSDPHAFDNGELADAIPAIVQAKVIESLENTKCFRSVTRPIDALESDLQLVLDIRTFAILAGPDLKADVDISANLVSSDGKVLGSRVIHEMAGLTAPDASDAVAALDGAFGKALRVLIPWATGLARSAHANAEPLPSSKAGER
ncbi:conserved protein of unknown function [Candidatus Filomicrobium marinum]|uniref:MCE family protein n=2 Tax=Filomicrobium TaxID=119044 RepID=A0A0D6JKL4_9HYPH|nr:MULTISPECIES: MlaD family protein [Filomicrobium]MCV0369068.1 MlaD family protein [Filomicrobium sp.]CFX62537.1 conserved protein of unknown function [Candidatus Filomicrobium marinum]CPR22509.1 conserved protein of unknown function [Candidatus Filomicrobium marinum]SDO81849.1 phospholipid/cholesterol/gamma-HCH transport system substrate-binding protein [Filomicrobium insigne]